MEGVLQFFRLTKGYPHDWCGRTMKNNYPEPKKCSICWVSHMFSIWESRYSYGICFGTVYALQNFTLNISTPNILSIFFSVHTRRVEIGHILCRRSRLYIYYIYYIYISYYALYIIYIILCYITLDYVMLSYVMLCYIMLCYVIFMLCYINYMTLCDFIVIILCHVMLCYMILYHIWLYLIIYIYNVIYYI